LGEQSDCASHDHRDQQRRPRSQTTVDPRSSTPGKRQAWQPARSLHGITLFASSWNAVSQTLTQLPAAHDRLRPR
jgi:hypothetical protein